MNYVEAMWFEGNFKGYDADFRRRKGAEADTPHQLLTTHDFDALVAASGYTGGR